MRFTSAGRQILLPLDKNRHSLISILHANRLLAPAALYKHGSDIDQFSSCSSLLLFTWYSKSLESYLKEEMKGTLTIVKPVLYIT